MKLVVKSSYHMDVLKAMHSFIFDYKVYHKGDYINRYMSVYNIGMQLPAEINWDIMYCTIHDLLDENIIIRRHEDYMYILDYSTSISFNPKYLRYFKEHHLYETFFEALQYVNMSSSELFYHNFIIP